ncbi:MAG: homoaconitase [Candidatus Marinimicrobia bacterium]|nr:homoaconitase [Candidatus Neomarinimicrobiota bacterium]
MSQNLIEKIVQKYSTEKKEVKSGDYVSIKPEHILTHDNTGAIIPKFKNIGIKKIKFPQQPMFALDHDVQNKGEKNIQKYSKIENFAKEMGVDFYPAGRGIGHQIMCEEGYAFPGNLAVASDSHSNTYGGIGCLGTPIVRTDAATIWATGETWWQIPPVVKIIFNGKLQAGVSGKDVALTIAGYFNHDELLNCGIEFQGEGVKNLSIDSRLSIANMSTEWGALVGIFPIDELTIEWLENRNKYILENGLEDVPSNKNSKIHPRINEARINELKNNILKADINAEYSKVIEIDLSSIIPSVSGPHSVKKLKTNLEIVNEKIKIHKAYLVSCVNARVEDLAEAGKILDGKKVAEHVELYVGAASEIVQKESEKRGDWKKIVDSGAIILPPGCGPCIGLGKGLLKDGEVGISATNRNFKGRMGTKDSKAYLASPATVAQSAIAGYIVSADNENEEKLNFSINSIKNKSAETKNVEILKGFKEKITGKIILCQMDNINTDGIFPGKYTYVDDFTPEQQAKVVMENYDSEFVKISKAGDVLIGGFNFGTGSSREQAATAFMHRGIQLIIAGSFSQTYKRNAINNGFIVIESPELLEDFKKQFDNNILTIDTEIECEINFIKSKITTGKNEYNFSPIGTNIQKIIIAGGIEKYIKK